MLSPITIFRSVRACHPSRQLAAVPAAQLPQQPAVARHVWGEVAVPDQEVCYHQHHVVLQAGGAARARMAGHAGSGMGFWNALRVIEAGACQA